MGYPSAVTDMAWDIIGPLLMSERGRWARPSLDNRQYFKGMIWIMRTGSPWRYLTPEYGKWNSVYVRFQRWAETGVWDAILETLVELGLTDNWADMLDSTTVRAHSQAAGGKGDSSECSWSKSRRLYDKSPRQNGRSRTPSRLCPDQRRSLGLQRR